MTGTIDSRSVSRDQALEKMLMVTRTRSVRETEAPEITVNGYACPLMLDQMERPTFSSSSSSSALAVIMLAVITNMFLMFLNVAFWAFLCNICLQECRFIYRWKPASSVWSVLFSWNECLLVGQRNFPVCRRQSKERGMFDAFYSIRMWTRNTKFRGWKMKDLQQRKRLHGLPRAGGCDGLRLLKRPTQLQKEP